MTPRRLLLLRMLGATVIALVPATLEAQLSLSSLYTVANAAELNKTEDVQALLNDGRDPNVVDSRGRTALIYAASFGNEVMAKLLLEHDAHVDGRDILGNTPLHWAAERGRVDIIRVLLAYKAPIDAQNRQGITPLMLAAGHGEAAASRLLVTSGADAHKQDFTGRDAFGWAAGKAAVVQALNAAR